MNILYSKKAFSIIEILVGIFIFTMGMISIYMLISSTLNLNTYNKNYTVATNLAKEQLELFRNIRDSNYMYLKQFNQINPSVEYHESSLPEMFQTGSYYTIENDFSLSASFPVKVEKITDFGEGVSELNGKMERYRLCLDNKKRYTYDCSSSGNTKTHFFRYLAVQEVVYNKSGEEIVEDKALKITSKVIWYQKGYHEFEVKSIITDWKRL